MDRDEKQKVLSQVILQIEKQFGKGSIIKMDEEARKDIEVGIIRGDKIRTITLSNKGISVLSE